jgi:hypothetical protein
MNERTVIAPEGFIKLNRSVETFELLKDRNAFILLTVIALRARCTSGFNIHQLEPGQALLGDCRAYGMSPQEYRGAKRRLQTWSLADLAPTSRGTVATLLNRTIYDIDGPTDCPRHGSRHK